MPDLNQRLFMLRSDAAHEIMFRRCLFENEKLEDLKVLKRSLDLLDNVKISQGQLRLIV